MKNYLRGYCAMLFALFGIMFSSTLSAQTPAREAYVVQSEDESTLTFYYDAQRASRTGKKWDARSMKKDPETSTYYPEWAGTEEEPNSTIKNVVFDDSFQEYRPSSTARWFSYCSELTEIKGLEHLNTEKVTDMSEMFKGCENLLSLNLQKFNTSQVTDMNSMFYQCSNLVTLDLQSFNTEKVTNMSAMFSNCSSLDSLNLQKFNTSQVTDMNSMFYECSKLTILKLQSFNTEKVTDMSSMFKGCGSLPSLDLQNFNTELVQYTKSMFADCTNLQSLNLNNFNTKSVEIMTEMFSGCSALTTIYCKSTWESSNSDDMFNGCVKLKGVAAYDATKTDAAMANPETGYFTAKPTAVNSVRQGEFGAQSIYTLQGKRVKGAWQHLPAGVYVVNGKKVIK